MNNIGKLVHESSWGDKVYVVIMRDKSGQRVSVELYIITSDEEMSDIVTITRKDVYTKKNAFDFLFDFGCGFCRDDIDAIKLAVVQMLSKDDSVESTQNRATLAELHQAVTEYIRSESEELEDNPCAEVFIKGEFGYLLTTKMDEFILENKRLGYKRLEVLKRLKIMGVLKNGKERPYDILVSVGGEKRRFYKIQLAGGAEEENADEVIKLDN